MSGAYFVDGGESDTLESLAPLLAGQLSHGGERVNHYAIAGGALLGLVSHDRLHQGVMPRYIEGLGLWGAMQGELYDCATRRSLIQKYGDLHDLDLFGRLWRDDALHAAAPNLNGAYFVMLWNPESHRLMCVNDRYGLYPMYWAMNGERFCLSDRVLCSVLAGAAEGRWDVSGAAQLLTIDDYVGETTLVDGVRVYPQATVLEKTPERVDWTRYWEYDFTPRETDRDVEDLADELGGRFEEAVRRQCKPGRPIGVTLSGGLDSRLIVAAASNADIPVQTFTWGKPGCYDRQFAKDVAVTFGTDHHDCEYEYQQFADRFDEGSRIAEGLVNYFDCHMLAHLHRLDGAADLILNGYAGDVILGGSFLRTQWLQPLSLDETVKAIFNWRNVLYREHELTNALPGFEMIPAELRPSNQFKALMAPLSGLPTPDLVDRFILENRQRRVTAMGTVLMRTAVESSACFFDYDLLDLESKVPASLRFEHRIYKEVMRSTFPKTLEIRWQRTLLPAGFPEWVSTPSKAFLKACRMMEERADWPRMASRQSPVDFAQWLRGPLKDWMESVIHDENGAAGELLSRDSLANLWQNHLDGADRTRYLGAVASLIGFGRAFQRARRGETAMTVKPERVEP